MLFVNLCVFVSVNGQKVTEQNVTGHKVTKIERRGHMTKGHK